MTLFGVIWLLLIIFAFFKKNIKYITLLTIIGMIWQSTNMISFGEFSCGPQLITSLVFILKSHLYHIDKTQLKTNISKNHIILTWLILAFYIFLNVIFVVKNFTFSYFINICTLFVYIYTFYRMYKISFFFSEKELQKIINCLTIVIILIGCFQLIVNIFHIPKNNIIGNLIYNDFNTNTYYFKDSLRFYSTFMEPSYVAGVLIALLFYYLNVENCRSKRIYCVFLLISLLLTFSSTGYLAFACVMLLYFTKKKKSKNLIMIILLSIVGIILLGSFTTVLDDVIFNKLNTGSGRVRTNWNLKAFEVFKLHPILGSGYHSVRASSVLYDILAELGIVGFLIYSIQLVICVKTILTSKLGFENTKYFYMLLSVILSSIIACPDLDLCSFWLVMYVFALNPCQNIKGVDLNEENRNLNIS